MNTYRVWKRRRGGDTTMVVKATAQEIGLWVLFGHITSFRLIQEGQVAA